MQRIAAAIAAGSVGLDQVHPGHLCDALMRSHLDLQAWTGRQILAAFNADMAAHGGTWPNTITNPGGFLAHRLKRLPVQPASPTPSRKQVRTESQSTVQPASAAARAAAIALFRNRKNPDHASRIDAVATEIDATGGISGVAKGHDLLTTTVSGTPALEVRP